MRMAKRQSVGGYPTDLTDEQWAVLAPLVARRPGPGRPPTASLRAARTGLVYVARAWCPWALLPPVCPLEPPGAGPPLAPAPTDLGRSALYRRPPSRSAEPVRHHAGGSPQARRAARLCPAAPPVGRGTDYCLARSEPPVEQGLRT